MDESSERNAIGRFFTLMIYISLTFNPWRSSICTALRIECLFLEKVVCIYFPLDFLERVLIIWIL